MLIPVDNKDALVTAYEKICIVVNINMIKRQFQQILLKFSPKTISKKLTDVYEDALKEKKNYDKKLAYLSISIFNWS